MSISLPVSMSTNDTVRWTDIKHFGHGSTGHGLVPIYSLSLLSLSWSCNIEVLVLRSVLSATLSEEPRCIDMWVLQSVSVPTQ